MVPNFYQYNKKSGYYLISNFIDGRVYVGLASNLYNRIGNHIRDLSKNRHGNARLQNFVNKYGLDNLLFNVLEICEKPTIEKEIEYMELFDSLNNGFNIVRDPRALSHIDRQALYANGSSRKGTNITEETRDRIKSGVKRYYDANPNKPRAGWSEYRREKHNIKRKPILEQKAIEKSLRVRKSNGRKGSKHHKAIIDENTVKLILLGIKGKLGRKRIMEKYDITVHMYKDIQARKSWKHVTI